MLHNSNQKLHDSHLSTRGERGFNSSINPVKSLAMPALGCGNGGRDWNIVRLKIEAYLAGLEPSIWVYEPKIK